MKKNVDSRLGKARIGKCLSELIPFAGLILMLAVFGILTGGKILRPKNLLLILNQTYVLLITATGVFFVMTIGGLDFSQGAIIGVAGIVIAYVARVSIPLAIVCGILTGTLIGLLNGARNGGIASLFRVLRRFEFHLNARDLRKRLGVFANGARGSAIGDVVSASGFAAQQNGDQRARRVHDIAIRAYLRARAFHDDIRFRKRVAQKLRVRARILIRDRRPIDIAEPRDHAVDPILR